MTAMPMAAGRSWGVGLYAPAGFATEPAAVARAVARLEAAGHRVTVDPTCGTRWQRFSATDDQRLAAVAFMAWFALTGTIDSFARILYYTSLAFTLLLASNAARFLKARFFLSAWAYSFPLAAVTIATLVMARHVGGVAFEWLALALLGVLTVVVALLVLRTALAMARGEICVDEG